MFGIHLLSHVDLYSLYRGIFHDCASGLLFHTFYCNFGRAEENRSFTEDLVYRGSLNDRKSRFHFTY